MNTNKPATLAIIDSASNPIVSSKAVAKVSVNGIEGDGLIDSGSSESFIHPDIIKRHFLKVQQSQGAVPTVLLFFLLRHLDFAELPSKWTSGIIRI